jgi:hypothetical protein
MTTVIINTRSTEAKKMVEFLRTTRYAKVLDDKDLTEATYNAIMEVEDGHMNTYASAKDLMANLKNKAGVQD